MAEMRALTIRQPWAWAIAVAGKDVENRSWQTSHRGLLAIHAGKGEDDPYGMPARTSAMPSPSTSSAGCRPAHRFSQAAAIGSELGPLTEDRC